MSERRRTFVDVRAVARFLIRSTRRAALTLAGFVLVCLGLAGLLLPVLPGWILIIGGFAVLSREYSWANSCLAFCRRHAARSSSKLRTMATQRRLRRTGFDDEVVIDLRRVPEEAPESAVESRSSQAR